MICSSNPNAIFGKRAIAHHEFSAKSYVGTDQTACFPRQNGEFGRFLRRTNVRAISLSRTQNVQASSANSGKLTTTHYKLSTKSYVVTDQNACFLHQNGEFRRISTRTLCMIRSEGSSLAEALKEDDRVDDLAKRIAGILPNAKLMKKLGTENMRRSLGVDFGLQRTGIAVSLCGFAPRPLEVVKLKGDELIKKLLLVARKQKADELVIGLPRSWDVQETDQSHKTRTFAGRLAQWCAEEGIRVFLQDEYMTSEDALEFMIYKGSTKKSRRLEVDAYAAMVILQTYFENNGNTAKLTVPKRGELQRKLCLKYYRGLYGDDLEEDEDNEDGDAIFI